MSIKEVIYEVIKNSIDNNCNNDTEIVVDGEKFMGAPIKRIYYDKEVNQLCIRINENEAMD